MAIGKKQLLRLFELVYAGELAPATALGMALGRIDLPKDQPAKEPVPEEVAAAAVSADSPTVQPGPILKTVREILGTTVKMEFKTNTSAATEPVAPAASVSAVSLFDINGRRIPPAGMKEVQCAPGCQRLCKPILDNKSDFVQRLDYFQLAFESVPNLDFYAETQKLQAAVAADERIASLLNGICLPIVLPPLDGRTFDYDLVLPQVFMAGAERTHTVVLTGSRFGHGYVGYTGRADERIKVVDTSHQRLIERMFRGCLVALYFPAALRGFSTYAQREQMVDPNLPGTLHLSGGVDVMTAVAMYPDILGYDYDYPLTIDMAALQCDNDRCSLGFKNRGACVVRCNLDIAHDRLFGGLVFYPE